MDDPLEKIVRRNLYEVMGALYPGSVLSHRTAFLGGQPSGAHIYATYKYSRNITLTAGVVVHFTAGPGPRQDDIPLPHNAWMSSEPRMFLENMQISRPRMGIPAKTVSREEVEERLIRARDARGDAWLNELRDRAKIIAGQFGWEAEYQRLYKLIGRLLGTQKAKLKSPVARGRTDKFPFDIARVEAFDRLAAYLRTVPVRHFQEVAVSRQAIINEAFFEAYFSNFIEGTEFEVEEAKSFVLDGLPPKSRPEDAHDIIGTYQLIIDRRFRNQTPGQPGEFISLLQERHEILMRQRPAMHPGLFKEKPDRAGNTHFVEPELVRGTLHHGFLRRESIPDPSGRAAYMMFLVSEVHPFDDGNGRIARLFMNAELSAARLARVIIPTVYREDYLSGMRAITRNSDDAAYVRMLSHAQDFSRHLDFNEYGTALKQLESANAFDKSNNAKLVMPTIQS
ncbi:MAG: Fic family protein [Gammaproteobacteria bacterium]|nr:Fic family protein [Gammaproteobacteria bacterium]